MFCGQKFSLDLSKKTYVMGILNITPDSFYDGGFYTCPKTAMAHALRMQDEGADIIDIGAMSTRPNSQKITYEEEIARLKPVLDMVLPKLDLPISVDTVYPETAKFCLSAGVAIINDVSGLFNEDMASVVKKYGAGWVICHTNARPAESFCDYREGLIFNIQGFFEDFIKKAENFGIKKSSICLDPGFGFSKDTAQNIDLLKNLKDLKQENIALLAGLSSKRFIGEVTGVKEAKDRLFGSLAGNIAAVYGGSNIVRVHNVKEHVEALKLIDAVLS